MIFIKSLFLLTITGLYFGMLSVCIPDTLFHKSIETAKVTKAVYHKPSTKALNKRNRNATHHRRTV